MNSAEKFISVKGRSRSLSTQQKEIFLLLKNYELNFSFFKNKNLFKTKKIFLEIGFGSGEIIFREAKKNPDHIYIGVEYYKRGVTQLLKKINDEKLKNIKIFHGDVHKLLTKLPREIFDEIWLFFPDPWPKKKHEKRRFIQKKIIGDLHYLVKPNGKLFISSDDTNYISWTLSLFLLMDKFDWLAFQPKDWRNPNNDYFGSRYEKKAALKNKVSYFLKFKKK